MAEKLASTSRPLQDPLDATIHSAAEFAAAKKKRASLNTAAKTQAKPLTASNLEKLNRTLKPTLFWAASSKGSAQSQKVEKGSHGDVSPLLLWTAGKAPLVPEPAVSKPKASPAIQRSKEPSDGPRLSGLQNKPQDKPNTPARSSLRAVHDKTQDGSSLLQARRRASPSTPNSPAAAPVPPARALSVAQAAEMKMSKREKELLAARRHARKLEKENAAPKGPDPGIESFLLALELAGGTLDGYTRVVEQQSRLERQTPAAAVTPAKTPAAITRRTIGTKKVPVASVKLLADCSACLEREPKKTMAVLACKHNYCRDCVTRSFTLALKERKPFTCCKQRVTLPHVGNFDAKFTKAYSHLLLEKSTKNPLYCAQPSCAAFIPDSQIQGGEEGVCLECKKRTCRHCKLESHHGVCAEDKEGLRLKELAKTKGWKECPGCKSMVERTVGCLHMTCTCTTQFCYSCGLVYRDCPKTCGR